MKILDFCCEINIVFWLWGICMVCKVQKSQNQKTGTNVVSIILTFIILDSFWTDTESHALMTNN